MLVPQLPFPLVYYRKNFTNAGGTEGLSKYILNLTLFLGNIEKSAKILNDVNDTVGFALELSQVRQKIRIVFFIFLMTLTSPLIP